MSVRVILLFGVLLLAGCAGLLGLSVYLAVAPDPETLTGSFYGVLECVTFSPDGTMIAAGGQNGEIRVWDVATRKELPRTLQGHQQPVHALSFSPDGRILASGSADGALVLWDMATGVESHRLGPDHHPFEQVHKDGPQAPDEVERGIKRMAFRPDGRILVFVRDRLVFWDPEMRKEKLSLGNTGSVETLRFSPDGRWLAVGGSRGVVLWDAETGQEGDTVYPRGEGPIPADLAFSPDGKVIAGAANDRDVYLWDVEERKEIAKLSGHTDRVVAVAFHPNGKMLASGDLAEQVIVWDLATKSQLTVRRQSYRSLGGNPGGPVTALAFSPEGAWLASAGGPMVKLWATSRLVR